MSDLVDFLRARLAEDERLAQEAGGGGELGRWRAYSDPQAGRVEDATGNVVVYDEGSPTEEKAQHMARHDPARVLAEVDAKRRILDEHAPFSQPQKMAWGEIIACSTCGSVDDSPTEWPCSTVRLMALPYADHPDYRDEWRP